MGAVCDRMRKMELSRLTKEGGAPLFINSQIFVNMFPAVISFTQFGFLGSISYSSKKFLAEHEPEIILHRAAKHRTAHSTIGSF